MISVSVLDETVDGEVTVQVVGDVDAEGAAQLYEALATWGGASATGVAVDLARVRSLGASGVSALFAARAVLWFRRTPLRVTRGNDVVDAALGGRTARDRLAASAPLTLSRWLEELRVRIRSGVRALWS